MLTYSTEPHRGQVTISVTGQLRAGEDAQPLVAEARAQSERDDVRALVIDVSDVDWMDFEGLAALLNIARTCTEHNVPFSICGAHGSVEAKLIQTGVLAYLEGRASF